MPGRGPERGKIFEVHADARIDLSDAQTSFGDLARGGRTRIPKDLHWLPVFRSRNGEGARLRGGRRQRGRIFGGPRLTSSPPGRRAPSGNIRAQLLSDLPRGGRKMITISHDSPKMWALRRSVDNGGQSWGVRLTFEISEPRRLDLDIGPQNSFTHETCRAGGERE